MEQANIRKATNVLGSPFNIVMSNATLSQMQKFVGVSGVPEHSMIVVNPINSKGNDESWSDLCITDNKDGVKSLLPFTSVEPKYGLLTVSNIVNPLDASELTGERRLTCTILDHDEKGNPVHFDNELFRINDDNQVTLLTKNLDDLNDARLEYITEIKKAQDAVEKEIDNLKKTINNYSGLAELLDKLAENNNAVETAQEYLDALTDDKNGDSPITKINNFNDTIEKAQNTIDEKGKNLEDKVTQLQKTIEDVEDELLGVVNDLKLDLDENYTPQKLQDTVEEVKKDYDAYNAKLRGLIDNTKDELHRETEALQKSLKDCVNDNLMPLVEAQVSSCLQDQAIQDALQPAVEAVLLNEFVEPCCKCDSEISNEDGEDGTPEASDPSATIKNPDVKQAILNTIADAINGAPGTDTEGTIRAAVLNTVTKALDSPQTSGNSSSNNPVNAAQAKLSDAVNDIANNQASSVTATAMTSVPSLIKHHVDTKFFRIASSKGKEKVITLSQDFYNWLNDVAIAAGATPIADAITPWRDEIPITDIQSL